MVIPTLERIKEGILITDSVFNILDVNTSLLNYLGIGRGDMVGNHCYNVTRCDHSGVGCPFLQVLKTGKTSTRRCTYFKKNGGKVYMEVTVHPLVEGKDADKFIHIWRDVTGQAAAEMELRDYIGQRVKKFKEVLSELRKN